MVDNITVDSNMVLFASRWHIFDITVDGNMVLFASRWHIFGLLQELTCCLSNEVDGKYIIVNINFLKMFIDVESGPQIHIKAIMGTYDIKDILTHITVFDKMCILPTSCLDIHASACSVSL